MRSILFCLLAAALSACTWEIYETQDGRTRLRQSYPTGTAVYYTEGAASQNTRYHGGRPMPHAVVPESRE